MPAEGTPRSTTGQGLRSIFTIRKGRKIIFTNPTARVRTGAPEDRDPMPLGESGELAVLRQALNCGDAARAALAALAAFHGLRNHQLRALLLTDVDGARLHINGRTILLADPVRQRLTAWLDRCSAATEQRQVREHRVFRSARDRCWTAWPPAEPI